jgi:hypothetical protein
VLGEACAALEAAARGAETATIEAACAAFERALAALQVRLDAHLERAAAPAGSS